MLVPKILHLRIIGCYLLPDEGQSVQVKVSTCWGDGLVDCVTV